jgi:predicted AlkP superfamily phosphohydrolase/phosphomutase
LRVFWSGKPDAFEHPRLGIIGPYPYLRTGAHRPEGFAVVTGPGIAPGDEGEIDMLDLAPTILELLGRRAPSWVEGTPITIPASHL